MSTQETENQAGGAEPSSIEGGAAGGQSTNTFASDAAGSSEEDTSQDAEKTDTDTVSSTVDGAAANGSEEA